MRRPSHRPLPSDRPQLYDACRARRHTSTQADPASGAASTGVKPLLGARITLAGSAGLDPALESEFNAFTERTVIDIVYEDSFETDIGSRAERGDFPDVAIVPQPALLLDWATGGELVDLGTYIDTSEARRQIGDYLVDAASLQDGYYAIPVRLDLKGLVWYPAPEFDQAEPPPIPGRFTSACANGDWADC